MPNNEDKDPYYYIEKAIKSVDDKINILWKIFILYLILSSIDDFIILGNLFIKYFSKLSENWQIAVFSVLMGLGGYIFRGYIDKKNNRI
jgi:hypothetical protein